MQFQLFFAASLLLLIRFYIIFMLQGNYNVYSNDQTIIVFLEIPIMVLIEFFYSAFWHCKNDVILAGYSKFILAYNWSMKMYTDLKLVIYSVSWPIIDVIFYRHYKELSLM